MKTQNQVALPCPDHHAVTKGSYTNGYRHDTGGDDLRSESDVECTIEIEDGSHDDLVCIIEREGGSHDPQDDVIYIRTTSDLAKMKEAQKAISQQLEKQKIQAKMTSFFRAGPLDEDQVRKNAEDCAE